MLPDTKETSDSSSDAAVEKPTDDPVPTSAEETKQHPADASTEGSDEPSVADHSEDAQAKVDLIDDDPLNFGDQRMDSPESEGAEIDEVSQLNAELAVAQAKAEEHWDRLVRLQAEMENQRKRAQNDLNKARKFALEGIVGDLLPVKDSLEMGLAAAQAEDADPKSIIEGAELTLKMLAQVFEKNNIAEVNPVDEKFDPEFHQAMSMQEIEGKAANTVASVMQKGYTLNDRLVRPALVMVAK